MNWAVLAIAALVAVFLIAPLYPLNAEYPTIFIETPGPYPAEVYQETSVPIKVKREFSPFETENKSVDIYYSLDGGPKIKLNITKYGISSDIFGVGTLENLTDGYHTVEAFSTDTQGNIISHSITFLVNTTIRFPAFLISPMNITYRNKRIPLAYNIDNSKYMIYYCIDDYGYYKVEGNITLPELPEGQHTITAKAYDLNGVIYSKQTVYFTIDATNQSPTPTLTQSPEFQHSELFPPILVVIIFVALITILGLLVYLKKRKR